LFICFKWRKCSMVPNFSKWTNS